MAAAACTSSVGVVDISSLLPLEGPCNNPEMCNEQRNIKLL